MEFNKLYRFSILIRIMAIKREKKTNKKRTQKKAVEGGQRNNKSVATHHRIRMNENHDANRQREAFFIFLRTGLIRFNLVTFFSLAISFSISHSIAISDEISFRFDYAISHFHFDAVMRCKNRRKKT